MKPRIKKDQAGEVIKSKGDIEIRRCSKKQKVSKRKKTIKKMMIAFCLVCFEPYEAVRKRRKSGLNPWL